MNATDSSETYACFRDLLTMAEEYFAAGDSSCRCWTCPNGYPLHVSWQRTFRIPSARATLA